ncbi:unnamed protein product, partial [Urochloa humidicola]
MSQEQKDEINRKRRETRLRNKIQKSNNQSSDKENNNTVCDTSMHVDDPETRKKEIARTRAAARRARMSQEQKDEINRKQRETRLRKKIQKSKNNQPSYKEDNNLGEPNMTIDPSTMIDPKEVKRVKDRTRIASQREAMSKEQKELVTKKRREAYHSKTPEEKEVRHDRQRIWNTTQASRESKKSYKRTLKEFRANNLHPDSIAKPSPHWTPELIDSESSNAKPTSSSDWVIPDFSGTPTPIYFPSPANQCLTTENPELRAARTIHRHRVTPGERTSLLSRRNQVFEETIAKNTKGIHDEDFTDLDDFPQSDVSDNGVAEVDAPKPDHTNRDAPQISAAIETQSSTVSHGIPNGCLPMNPGTTNTYASEFEDDDDEHVVFEEDDEEDEGYLFGGQDEEDEADVDVDFVAHMDDASEPEVEDPYDGVYANVPSETHMLEPVDNCKFCNAKKFESETDGFCCRGGKIHLPSPDTPPELMRLWSSSDADARHFRANIRFFNDHFSFTSLYCKLDRMTTNMRDCGIYTFRAH